MSRDLYYNKNCKYSRSHDKMSRIMKKPVEKERCGSDLDERDPLLRLSRTVINDGTVEILHPTRGTG